MDRDTSPRGGDGNDVDDVGNNVAAATTVGTSTRLRRRRQGLATSLLATTKQILPVVAWAPHYRPAFLFDDFISALTVATVVIPQSMAYAILAGLKPQYGLYTAVIPVVLYALMGTSRHLQIGCFALTSLLLNKAVSGIVATHYANYGASPAADTELLDLLPDSIFVGVTLTLSVFCGVVMMALAVLRVGSFMSRYLLPDALIAGFTSAAAVHIATSQVKGLLGLPMPTIFGTFGLARSWFYIFQHIRETQLAALLISLGNMAFIAGVDWFNNKYILSSSNAARVPLPVEAPPESRPTTPESDVENDQRPRSSSASPVSISMRVQSPMRLSPIHQLEVGVEAANIEIYDEDTSHPRPTVESDRRSIHTVHTSTPSTTGSNSSGRRLLPSPEKSTTMSSPISMLPTSYVEPTPPRPRKIPSFRCTIPIPAILLAVFLSTLIVYTAQLYVSKANGGAGVAIIGKVPAGFPSPLLPMTPAMLCPDIYNGTIATVPLSKEECSALISGVALTTARSSLTLAVVTMVMTMAIVKLYAKQLQYEAEVRPNQDIFALGIAAIGGALLGQSLLPCGSLSRTAIMVKTNGRTQMSSLLGAVVVAVVILVATGLLTYVPLASLSAVVVMAVKNLIMQVRGGVVLVQRARIEGRRQQWEALIFWWTYIMALVVDVDVGLGAGMCLCAAGGLFELAHAAYRKRMERRMPSEEDGVVVS